MRWPPKCSKRGADVGLGFDGDGDRCGVVDNRGEEIFADKIGVMLARDLSKLYPGSTFVVDVKSTGLFATDPQLLAQGVKADYWKTGHSYIKRRVTDLKALAGFEKSGHFFFNAPVGRGYDDGILTAIHVIEMLDRNPHKSMAELYEALPKTWGSPTMSPHCDDEVKYGVVDKVTERFKAMQAKGELLTGQKIRDLVTVNGVRVTHGGRHLGTRARLLEQAGTRRRRGKPGVGSKDARDVRGGRWGAAREPGSRGV